MQAGEDDYFSNAVAEALSTRGLGSYTPCDCHGDLECPESMFDTNTKGYWVLKLDNLARGIIDTLA